MVRPSPGTANHKRSSDLTMALAMRDWTAKNDKRAFGTGLRHGMYIDLRGMFSVLSHGMVVFSIFALHLIFESLEIKSSTEGDLNALISSVFGVGVGLVSGFSMMSDN